MTSADTTAAGRYSANGREYSTAAKYDSAIIFFEKAKDLYEKNEDWEKLVQSYTKIGEQYRRKHLPDQAITTLKQAQEFRRLKLGVQTLACNHYEFGIDKQDCMQC